MTDLRALVPVKRREAAKLRLAPRLAPAERLALSRAMLDAVAGALAGSAAVREVVFVSAERDTIPARHRVLADPGGGLNVALESARALVAAEGADEILVLPADLPLVAAADVDAFIAGARAAGLAIAGDAAGTGTNALLLPARAPFRFRFGPDSLAAHQAEARRAGFAAAVVERPGLGFDVDTPEDLECLLATGDARYAFVPAPGGGGTWPIALGM